MNSNYLGYGKYGFHPIAISAAKPRTDIAVSFLPGVYLPMQYAVRLSRAKHCCSKCISGFGDFARGSW